MELFPLRVIMTHAAVTSLELRSERRGALPHRPGEAMRPNRTPLSPELEPWKLSARDPHLLHGTHARTRTHHQNTHTIKTHVCMAGNKDTQSP